MHRAGASVNLRLSDLDVGETAHVEELALPEEAAHRLMTLGLVPGSQVTVVRSVPGGDPRVYRVDGAEIALRSETAAQVRVRRVGGEDQP